MLDLCILKIYLYLRHMIFIYFVLCITLSHDFANKSPFIFNTSYITPLVMIILYFSNINIYCPMPSEQKTCREAEVYKDKAQRSSFVT